MDTNDILAPVATLALWSMVMWVWMYATRIPAMQRAKIDAAKMVGGTGKGLDDVLPPEVQWKAHNYNHLMEQPTVFYAVALALALMGGAKVSDKIPIMKRLVRVADQIIIGGAMANTFLAHRGHSVGASKVEPDQGAVIDAIYDLARRKVGDAMVDNFLVLPTDVAIGLRPDDHARRRCVPVDQIPPDGYVLDIGDASIERTVAAIARSQTIIWNGTFGMAEFPRFAHGSARVALELAEHPEKASIIGGGDTSGFVIQWDARHGDSFSHVSTGGGAGLELMAGDKLPGIEALLDA